MKTVATCSTTDGNSSYHGIAPSFSDVKNIALNDQTTLMVHRNSANTACTFRFYICLHLRDRDRCFVADGSDHTPTPSYFEEMTCCWRQKLHSRWPGNPNSWSKFRNLGLLTFTRSQLTLRRRRLRGWWRLLEIAQTARSRRQKHHRDDQDRSKFRKHENLCIRDQAKSLKKRLFAATNDAAIDSIAHCFFFCYHSQLLFSHSKNNLSTTLTPTEKPRYTYCRVFL